MPEPGHESVSYATRSDKELTMFTNQFLPAAVPPSSPGQLPTFPQDLGAFARRPGSRAQRVVQVSRGPMTVYDRMRIDALRRANIQRARVTGQQMFGQPPWCPWSRRWGQTGLSAGPIINTRPIEQRARLMPAAYTAAVEEKQEPIVSQGRWMPSPAPYMGAVMARRKKELMTSPARLPVRGFATRFKQETMQRINRIPSDSIPGEAIVDEPDYVRNVEVIAFAEAPVGSLERGGDRDGRYRMEGSGFLRSRLSF